ncbi:MAG: spore photoproduct lyase family protein [Chlamydiota bacterium]
MHETIYVEKEIASHRRTLQFLQRFRSPRIISCDNYQEIFNRRNQSFREQKKSPAWIVAKKHGALVHSIPKDFAIGGENNYYFSHVLNCPYDCTYCFLQGMYSSAYYVFFINFEEVQAEIERKSPAHFFSGYDGDSLALEPKTHFLQEFLPFFASCPENLLEIRTKSLYVRPFMHLSPIKNVVIAWSLNPQNIVSSLEKKTPSLEKRLDAAQTMQKRGWKIGLRFDPVIFQDNFQETTRAFFAQVFAKINAKLVHSATLGAFRLPVSFRKQMEKNVANKKILAHVQGKGNELVYENASELLDFSEKELGKYLSKKQLFRMDGNQESGLVNQKKRVN